MTRGIVVVDERPGMQLAAKLGGLPGVEVQAEVGTASEAMEAVQALEPRAVVLDISLPRLGGLALVRSLRRLYPKVPVLAVAPSADRRKAAGVLKAGARALLLREGAPRHFSAALEAIGAGRPYVDPRVEASRTVLRPRRARASAA